MITFTTQPTNPPHHAYNNSVIEFGVDAGVPSVANITAGGYTFEIFPDLQGQFYFNFKSIIKALINPDHFEDSIIATSGSYLFNDSSLFYELALNVEVILEDGTSQTSDLTFPFLKSVDQVIRNRYTESQLKILTPGASQVAHLSYFEGYPFDVAIYSDAARSVTVANVRTGISTSLNLSKGVNRLFVSNGENDSGGFEGVVPLHLGVNELEFKIGTEIKATLFLDKKEADCGFLLKWFNPNGSWSYWRFMDLHIENISTGTIERLNTDFQNLNTTFKNISITGKEVGKDKQLMSGLVDEQERILLDSLLYAPEVQLYTNALHQPMAPGDFVGVEIAGGNFSRSNKNKLSNLSIKAIMPNIYTQTL